MTRKEEIKEARHEWYLRTQDADFCAGFQKGAEWADRSMIDKACEWLRVELDKEEEQHYIHVHGFDKEHREIFLENFRKAMEGE